MNKKKNTYWLDVKVAILSACKGIVLTIIHFRDAITKKKRRGVSVLSCEYFDYDKGIVTLQYPKEKLPVPDVGRYKLHNEIDDCIVCDKCAKVCPVDCIDIEPIKSPHEIRKTSDGSSVRMYAATFDIDMAKCCFCGLCTTVCPTECLTMTKDYDFSSFELADLNYGFSEMSTDEILQRKEEYDIFALAKAKAKEKAVNNKKVTSSKPKLVVQKLKTEDKSTTKPKIVISKPKIESKAKPKVIIPKPKTEAKAKPKVVIQKPKTEAKTKPRVVIPKPKSEAKTKPKVVIPKAKSEAKTKPKVVIPKPKIEGKAKPKVVIPKPKIPNSKGEDKE